MPIETASEIIDAIRVTALKLETQRLTFAAFSEESGVNGNQIHRHFDSWSDACRTAGIECGPTGGENLRPNPRIDEATCISELRRVAKLLGSNVLTKRKFDLHASFSSYTVLKRFGGWVQALSLAGLQKHENCRDEIPLLSLAKCFLDTAVELRRIPTVRQVVRRAPYGLNSFTRKWGSYGNFKIEAIALLLEAGAISDDEIRCMLETEFARLDVPSKDCDNNSEANFHTGRTLGFRAFAYAPTYEQEVVGIFGNVAEELGFEIVSQRVAFPDCLARRRLPGPRERFIDCRIEFELRSKDFQTHKHPANGCDLIVCWEHNWEDSPVEVLELQTAIRSLPGWK